MPAPLLLEFPPDEYQARISALTTNMQAQGLDAIILTSKDHTRYFCGFQIIVWISNLSKPGALVITRDGETAFVGPYGRLSTVEVCTLVDEMCPWDAQGREGLPDTYPEAIHDVLTSKGIQAGRVGMEIGPEMRVHLSYDDFTDLRARMSAYEIVDAGPAIWPLRQVKSPREIERMRKACAINSTAFERAIRSIHPGMTEMELHRRLCIEMFELGAEDSLLNGVRAGAERYPQGNSPPSDRPIGVGEMIIMDGGPVYRGYYSDIIRQAIVGPPTDRQRSIFDTAVETCYEGLKHIRAGAVPEDIVRAIDAYAARSPHADLYRSAGWSGHSLGLTVHEPPMIDLSNRAPLQAGMVLAIEPEFYEEGVGIFGIEQNILVTETGYDLLSPADHGLWEL